MALKAGRVGVNNSQVDIFGNIIAEASGGYTKAEADAKFLNKVDAASEYLTQTGASSTYETQTHASATYETQAHASATYETQAGASATYETQAHASATYETQTNAASTYETKSDASTAYTNLSNAMPDYTDAVTQNNGKAVFDNLDPNCGYDIEYVVSGNADPVVIPKWTALKREDGTETGTIKLTYTVTGTDGSSQYKLYIKR